MHTLYLLHEHQHHEKEEIDKLLHGYTQQQNEEELNVFI